MRAKIEELGVKFVYGQWSTEARDKALLDVRLTYLMACLILAVMAHTPGEYKWNFDATTYEIHDDGHGEVYAKLREKKDENEPLTTSKRASGIAIFIKFVAIISAVSEFGPAVFIVPVDSMPEEAFFAIDVNLLTFNPAVGSSGRMFFCKTRAGNAALWKDFFLDVLIPTLRLCQQSHQLKVSDVCT